MSKSRVVTVINALILFGQSLGKQEFNSYSDRLEVWNARLDDKVQIKIYFKINKN